MPPGTKQQKHLKKIAQERNMKVNVVESVVEVPRLINFIASVDPDLLVVACIANGLGYAEARRILLMCNIKPPSEATFYQHQIVIGPKISEKVAAQVDFFASKIADDASLSEDGCWNHPKNGSAATVTIFDNKQKKVVAYAHILKAKGYSIGNFTGASNMMESAGVRLCLDQISPNVKGKRITFTHDHDNKSGKILNEFDENAVENYDPGHASKEVKRKAESYFTECAKSRKEAKIVELKKSGITKIPKSVSIKAEMEKYTPMIYRLVEWFKYLVYSEPSEEVRENLWENSVFHFHPSDFHAERGRPRVNKKEEFWEWKVAKEDSSYFDELVTFLHSTSPLIKKVSQYHTQDLESLNSKIARARPKSKHFSTSNSWRAEMAIGSKNDPYFLSDFLAQLFPTSLSVEAISYMQLDEKKKKSNNDSKKLKTEMQKKNELRRQERMHNKTTKGDYKDKSKPFVPKKE